MPGTPQQSHNLKLVSVQLASVPVDWSGYDQTLGYQAGSVAFITSTNELYDCINASVGAAEWGKRAIFDANSQIPVASNADYVGTTDPTVNNDAADTAVLGQTFRVTSLWSNTTDRRLWYCRDATATSAKWDLVSQTDATGNQIFSKLKPRLIAIADTTTIPTINEMVNVVDNVSAPMRVYGFAIGDGVTARGVMRPWTIASKSTDTGNVTTGVDTLWSVSVPGNTLARNGDVLRFDLGIFTAANINNKEVVVSFGGTTIFDSTALALNGADLSIEGIIIRTSATTVRCIVRAVGDSALLPSTATYSTVTVTLANAAGFLVTGEATDSDDVVLAIGRLTFEPAE